jgi:hypothetical protein
MALEIARVAEESEKSHLQRMADLLRSPDSDEEDEGDEDEYEEDEE